MLVESAFPQASVVLITLGAVAITALIGGLWTLLQRRLTRRRIPEPIEPTTVR